MTVDLKKCTKEFQEIFDRYQKYKLQRKRPVNIQKILDEKRNMAIDTQTEEEFIYEEFVENRKIEKENNDYDNLSPSKSKNGKKKDKKKPKKLKKQNVLNVLITEAKDIKEDNNVRQSLDSPINKKMIYNIPLMRRKSNVAILHEMLNSSNRIVQKQVTHAAFKHSSSALPLISKKDIPSLNNIISPVKDYYKSLANLASSSSNIKIIKEYERHRRVDDFVKFIEKVEGICASSRERTIKTFCNNKDISELLHKKYEEMKRKLIR